MSEGERASEGVERAFLGERTRALRREIEHRADGLRADDPDTGPVIARVLGGGFKERAEPAHGMDERVRSALGPLLDEIEVLADLEGRLGSAPLGELVLADLRECQEREDDLAEDGGAYLQGRRFWSAELRSAALDMVRRGETTLQEINRVTFVA